MNENNQNQDKIDGEQVKIKSPLASWFENFTYHYKWHAIAAIFIILVVIICSVQMCSKQSYDAYILYAGGGDIRKVADEGDISEFRELQSTLSQYCEDYDGDGTKNLYFETLFIPSQEEIDKIEATGEYEVNYSLILENRGLMDEYVLYGNYYVMLLSESQLLSRVGSGTACAFAPITPYMSGDYETCGEFGVYLRSTPLYEKAGFSQLPEDTVICMRAFSEVSAQFGGEENRENFRRSEEILRKLLA